MTPDAFFTIPNGTQEYNHGADQCVALANLYSEDVLGVPFVPVNSAYQWWTDFAKYPQLVNNYSQISVNDAPIHGDIFIAKGGFYDSVNGHIGVVESGWDGSTFATMEQNAGSGAKRYVWRYNRTKANMLGFLRPNNQTLINPTIPTVNHKETQMLICHTMDGRTPDQGPLNMIFGTDFYQSFGGDASPFAAQIGGPSMPVSQAFIDSVKAFIDAGRK